MTGPLSQRPGARGWTVKTWDPGKPGDELGLPMKPAEPGPYRYQRPGLPDAVWRKLDPAKPGDDRTAALLRLRRSLDDALFYGDHPALGLDAMLREAEADARRRRNLERARIAALPWPARCWERLCRLGWWLRWVWQDVRASVSGEGHGP